MISFKLLRGAAGLNHTLAPAANLVVPNLTSVPERNLFTGTPAQQAASLNLSKRSRLNPDLQGIAVPPKPKKPVTPWLAYLHERKDEVIARNGPMTASQLAMILSKDWQGADKSRYQADFERKLKQYHLAKDAYQNSLTDEQRAVIEHQKNLQKESKELRQLRATKPPLQPRNSLSLYCSERCKHSDVKERMKNEKSTAVLKDLKEEYKRLSDSEKQKYLDMQADDRRRFGHEFIKWHHSVSSDITIPKALRDRADALYARFAALKLV